MDGAPLLAVKDLSISFRDDLVAIDRVSFSIRPGTTLGLVGASGAGKSSIARAVMRLVPADHGQILFKGQDITRLGHRALTAVRRRMQIVFQDPSASLSPRRTVAQTLQEPLRHLSRTGAAQRKRKIASTLAKVGLQSDVLERYPHQFSSGQQQRIAIARALITDPELLIADEAVAALDVSVQAQILRLLMRLQNELGIALLFISHDLAVIRQIADEVAVMYRGQLLEHALADDFFGRPAHPYGKALLDFAEFRVDPRHAADLTRPRHSRPTAGGPGATCVYAAQCAERLPRCRHLEPPYVALPDDGQHKGTPHCVKCHLHDV